jgi:uncharacterized membrane protein (UPF0127 family)
MAALINGRTLQVVASSVEIADTRAARRRGLLGRASFPSQSAMVLTSCNAVHTFFMQFPIDIAFVDAGGGVVKIVRDLPPWRIAVAPRAWTTIEFASGELDSNAIGVGDRLYLTANTASSES